MFLVEEKDMYVFTQSTHCQDALNYLWSIIPEESVIYVDL